MLNFIYTKIQEVMKNITSTDRRLTEIEKQQAKLLVLVQEIHDALLPEPATTIALVPGKVEEQP